jgi:hypothetical protein
MHCIPQFRLCSPPLVRCACIFPAEKIVTAFICCRKPLMKNKLPLITPALPFAKPGLRRKLTQRNFAPCCTHPYSTINAGAFIKMLRNPAVFLPSHRKQFF